MHLILSERKTNQFRTEGIDADAYDPVKELNLVDVEVKYNKFKCPTIPQRPVPMTTSRSKILDNLNSEYESISSSKWYKSSEKSLRIVRNVGHFEFYPGFNFSTILLFVKKYFTNNLLFKTRTSNFKKRNDGEYFNKTRTCFLQT